MDSVPSLAKRKPEGHLAFPHSASVATGGSWRDPGRTDNSTSLLSAVLPITATHIPDPSIKCKGGWGRAGGLPENRSLRLGVTADSTNKSSLN